MSTKGKKFPYILPLFENRTPLLVGEHYKHSKVLEVKTQGREHTVTRPWHRQSCPCVSLPGEEAQVQRVEEDFVSATATRGQQ